MATNNITFDPPAGRALQKRQTGLFQSFRPVLPAIILFYSFLLPQEARIEVLDQVIYPYRGAIILLSPLIIAWLVKGRIRFSYLDALVLFYASWMILSFAGYYQNLGETARSLPLVFDVLGPYIVARASIRSLHDLRIFLIAIAPAAFFAGALITAESLTRTNLYRSAFASAFGQLPYYVDGQITGSSFAAFQDYRLGLLRGQGPFYHPIHAGIVLSSLLTLYYFSGLKKWPMLLGLVAGACSFFSLSSAALLGLVMFVGLAFFDRITRLIDFLNWKQAIIFGSLGIFIMQILSSNGLLSVISSRLLNPRSGYIRMLIWQYGMESVSQNPWFGIGFNSYERRAGMTTSIDNHWLAVAVRHGVVPAVCILFVLIMVFVMLTTRNRNLPVHDRNLVVGLAIVLFTTCLIGFTVAFFASALTWFFLLLGLSVSLVVEKSGIPKVPQSASGLNG